MQDGVERRGTGRCVAGAVALGALLWPAPVRAIPVFARIYDKPCHACHTVYPQLNAAGEAFRAHGLHGLVPAIQPLELTSYLSVPGTLPLALQLAAGEDVTRTRATGASTSTVAHFDLDYLNLLAGGELGPSLSFLADYSPYVTDPQTGDAQNPTRPGLAYVNAHAEPGGWLGNLTGGLFELPVGQSPRVHRLTVRPYLIYGITPLELVEPNEYGSNQFDYAASESLLLASAQIGGQVSLLDPDTGFQSVLGVTTGSNNRIDHNESADAFIRIGEDLPTRRLGLFLYYTPNSTSEGANDQLLRLGPDATLSSRQARLAAQFLAGWDSNPTGVHDSLWYYGGFVEGEYRFTPALISILRIDYVGMPNFDDRGDGGTAHARRRLWEGTGGLQYLIEDNLKVVAELTYAENHDAVSGTNASNLTATLRLATAFWPLTPPLLNRWAGGVAPQ